MKLRIKKNSSNALGWHLMIESAGKLKYAPQSSWPPGFTKSLTYEQALALQRSYNARPKIAKDEGKRIAAEKRVAGAALRTSAWLPDDIVALYEKSYLGGLEGKALANAKSLWKAVQGVVLVADTDPSLWSLNSQSMHKHIERLGSSVDWAKRVLKRLNKYGYLYCVQRRLPFIPLDNLSDSTTMRIDEVFHEHGRAACKSDKITEHDLFALKSALPAPEYLWVLLSFWYGLRPEEVDLLGGPNKSAKGRELWRYENKILRIYQPKLRNVRPENRYKSIPATLPEQEHAMKQLAQGIQRPSRTLIRKHFPPGAKLYAGRHGFTSYWQAKGVALDVISSWLGHRHISTTETYYSDTTLIRTR